MRYCLYLICGAILICLATTTPATAAVMLAGGHLPVCSSMAPAQCSGSTDWTEQALDEHRFRIDTEALRRWTEAVDQSADQSMARDWLQLLVHLRDDDGRWQTRAELAALIRSTRLSFPDQADREDILGEALYQTADHQQWMRLLDHFQQPVGDRREQVKLAHSRNSASVEVFERFVAMAAALSERPRPLIAVSTASSRDPYDALDFYLQVFEQAGAEVIWLPLDAAVHRARELGQCEQLAEFQASELGSHDRQRVWPRQYEQQVRF
ncbi:MAG: hypothetical protein LAT56_16010, partial [Wenzhouxiangella sp.]|nr:hypothetical protein [Wenzhouxiangella sp.]